MKNIPNLLKKCSKYFAIAVGLYLVGFLFYWNFPSFPSAPRVWQGAGEYNGGGQAAIVVSVGPRCDGVLHTIKLDENFQPIHAGCKVEWGINDNSPQKCIVLVDANSDQLDPPACSGSERDFAGIPITGWQSANGEVLLDVIYR